jgi:hypothetical protein
MQSLPITFASFKMTQFNRLVLCVATDYLISSIISAYTTLQRATTIGKCGNIDLVRLTTE